MTFRPRLDVPAGGATATLAGTGRHSRYLRSLRRHGAGATAGASRIGGFRLLCRRAAGRRQAACDPIRWRRRCAATATRYVDHLRTVRAAGEGVLFRRHRYRAGRSSGAHRRRRTASGVDAGLVRHQAEGSCCNVSRCGTTWTWPRSCDPAYVSKTVLAPRWRSTATPSRPSKPSRRWSASRAMLQAWQRRIANS